MNEANINDIFSRKNQYRKQSIIDELVEEVQKKIGVLCRVSTDMQVQEGDSLEMQHELAEEHAEKIDGAIFKYYEEEGLSAWKNRIEKRPQILKLMQDIEEGKVNYVIAYKRDRMFRNNIEHMRFFQFLADNNCDIYFSARGELQVDLSTFKVAGASKMMETMLSMMAEMESANTSARVSDTMISKAFRGERTGGRLPVGYQFEDEKIVPIEGAEKIIELIEDMYLNGYGAKSISKWLNGGDVKGLSRLDTPIPKPTVYSKTKSWNERNIKTILFNPMYTGYVSYQSKKNTDMDRIISASQDIEPMRSLERQKQIFELQQKKVEERKPPRAYNTPFILSGLIYCDECGKPLKTQTSQLKEGARYSYYKCGHRYTDKAKKCKMGRIYRKEILEKLVLEAAKVKIEDFLDQDTYEIFNKKSQNEKDVALTHVKAVGEKIDNLNYKLQQYIETIGELKESDKPLKEFYLSEQRKILRELSELELTYDKLKMEIEQDDKEADNFQKYLELAKNFSNIIDTTSVGIQKQFLESLFSAIYIDNNGDVRLELKLGVAKKEKVERLTESVLFKEPERKEPSKVPSFISLETIRDWRDSKHINAQSLPQTLDTTDFGNDWTITFNYFETLRELYEQARISFYPYLCVIDPKLKFENVHLINEDELDDYVPAVKSVHRDTKKLNTYIQQKLNITKGSRTRLIYGHLPPLKKMKEYLKLLSSDITNFFIFVKEQYPNFFIDESMFEEIEASVNSKSIKTQYLFNDLIRCEKCGSNYVGKKEGKGVRYSCIKNRMSAKHRCNSYKIKEPILIELVEKETNCKVTRELLLQFVENVIVSKNDEATIIYHKDFQAIKQVIENSEHKKISKRMKKKN